ncbi:Short-chain dehydrogenase/reductase SDR [Penicillium concentricum]|uniref:Short-chain dehydrogenase/reductase SDR n=1 Tax=Penicillium concentricum TaxID=293559 RepID=A0A9W9UWL4_9EURO|nr:Short-chain dehydrogenase/reductase SDR [Penicillium concentricum]KAJ5360072.1 Short-chain dehydrogenase/reductase SDR [Penicillium concentricum]
MVLILSTQQAETVSRLVGSSMWKRLPDSFGLWDGGESAGRGLTDMPGSHLPREELYRVAVEISDSGFYFRDQHAFCDEGMREVMGATVVENQVGAFLNG